MLENCSNLVSHLLQLANLRRCLALVVSFAVDRYDSVRFMALRTYKPKKFKKNQG